MITEIDEATVVRSHQPEVPSDWVTGIVRGLATHPSQWDGKSRGGAIQQGDPDDVRLSFDC
jgi:hypothetical protein